jgi:hypothetical protein
MYIWQLLRDILYVEWEILRHIMYVKWEFNEGYTGCKFGRC